MPQAPVVTHISNDNDFRAIGEMLEIPGGRVWIGSDDGSDAERPRHVVEAVPFLIDATPVTNAAFRRFVSDAGYMTEVERAGAAWGYSHGEYKMVAGLCWLTYAQPERDMHPVVLVSWNDAAAFAEWAGKRLPTEIEWETAARGGLENALYPWGDDDPDGRCNWRRQVSDVPPTAAVATFSANAYGVYDLVGNVWQWCVDQFQPYYGVSVEPTQPDLKARRGGAWNVIQSFRLRCANRGAMVASMAAPNVGFRCARSL